MNLMQPNQNREPQLHRVVFAEYSPSAHGSLALDGFFEGWPNPPSETQHHRILEQSYLSLIALEPQERKVVGFVNCVSDGVLSCYIPLLEVLPPYRGQGIGTALVDKMLRKLDDFYMVDLSCDESLVNFYQARGLSPARAMLRRSYDQQSGRKE